MGDEDRIPYLTRRISNNTSVSLRAKTFTNDASFSVKDSVNNGGRYKNTN